MENHEKFLRFNGKNLVFLNSEGRYWIALKPICEALDIEYTRSFKNGKKQVRNVTCIPEEFIYGWIFSLRSDNEKLTEYKRTCYQLLFNHFHGEITNRKELLMERRSIDTEIYKLKAVLKEEEDRYKQLHDLQNKRKLISTQLNSIDKDLIKQPDLFDV